MSGKVYVREWADIEQVWEAIAVEVAPNGVVEVCAMGEGGDVRRGAWWKWKSDNAETFYAYLEELAHLPGWHPDYRQLIWDQFEQRRDARERRYVSHLRGEASQGKGSAFGRRAPSSRP